ncbi:MAG: Gfo/Idh/MocA family protein [Daejeonella sp.]|uniref:Gfo/Idh/MocA family protein n=1 Tax=Daejeonella sp. JGW-45 TaxID=3034148 RepID=UPI0023EC6EF8|nr:Gfo/Idh/MocA family oxidoreductase [Daejeonella sp. JGW-45]
MNKIRWGILSTAKIGVEKVIPAMKLGKYSTVAAIASRDPDQASKAASSLQIPKSYGSYQDLLDDSDVDAVYIPLPNHLHVEWAIKALNAGKHVLLEKPVGLSSTEAKKLLVAAKEKPGLKVMEAFMYRHHPQWQKAKMLVENGDIGKLRSIQTFFSYYNTDPENIRHNPQFGGGGLMDIGCYCISLSRYIFGQEPSRVSGLVEFDPLFKTDRMASAILDFSEGTSAFTCSTQIMPFQRVNIFGDTGGIEIEIPFNAPPDRPTRLWLHTMERTQEIVFDICDQYTIQGDLFSKAILTNSEVPTPLEDALNNMLAIEAVFKSSETGEWVNL